MIYSIYKVDFEKDQKDLAIPQEACIIKTLKGMEKEYGKAVKLVFKDIHEVSEEKYIHIKSLFNEFSKEI